MKQKRKVKSLLFHKRYGKNFLITALLLIISVILCIGSLSLMTMKVFAENTGFYYEGLDDKVEVIYKLDFANPIRLNKVINTMEIIGKSLYVGPSSIIVDVMDGVLKNDNYYWRVYANILGGFGNKVNSNNVTLIGGSGNSVNQINDNASVLGGEGNKIYEGTLNGTPAVMIGGTNNEISENHDGVGIIGGEENKIGKNVSNSFILGGSGNKIGDNSQNVIVGGKNVDISGTNNVFVYSNDDNIFMPKSSNAFYLNMRKGVGINTESRGTGISVGGAVSFGEIDISITCTGDYLGVQGVYSGCIIGCTKAGGEAGGKWEMLDRGGKCKKVCDNSSYCIYTDDTHIDRIDYTGGCTTGNIDINPRKMHMCNTGADLQYRDVVFEASIIDSDADCANYAGNDICLFQCNSGYHLTGVEMIAGTVIYKCFKDCDYERAEGIREKIRNGEIMTGYNESDVPCALQNVDTRRSDGGKFPETCSNRDNVETLQCRDGEMYHYSYVISGRTAPVYEQKYYKNCYGKDFTYSGVSFTIDQILAPFASGGLEDEIEIPGMVDRDIIKGKRGKYRLYLDYKTQGVTPSQRCEIVQSLTGVGNINLYEAHYEFIGCNPGYKQIEGTSQCKQECMITSGGDVSIKFHGWTGERFRSGTVKCPEICESAIIKCDDGKFKMVEGQEGFEVDQDVNIEEYMFDRCSLQEEKCEGYYLTSGDVGNGTIQNGGLYSGSYLYNNGYYAYCDINIVTGSTTTGCELGERKYQLIGCESGYHSEIGNDSQGNSGYVKCISNQRTEYCMNIVNEPEVDKNDLFGDNGWQTRDSAIALKLLDGGPWEYINTGVREAGGKYINRWVGYSFKDGNWGHFDPEFPCAWGCVGQYMDADYYYSESEGKCVTDGSCDNSISSGCYWGYATDYSINGTEEIWKCKGNGGNIDVCHKCLSGFLWNESQNSCLANCITGNSKPVNSEDLESGNDGLGTGYNYIIKGNLTELIDCDWRCNESKGFRYEVMTGGTGCVVKGACDETEGWGCKWGNVTGKKEEENGSKYWYCEGKYGGSDSSKCHICSGGTTYNPIEGKCMYKCLEDPDRLPENAHYSVTGKFVDSDDILCRYVCNTGYYAEGYMEDGNPEKCVENGQCYGSCDGAVLSGWTSFCYYTDEVQCVNPDSKCEMVKRKCIAGKWYEEKDDGARVLSDWPVGSTGARDCKTKDYECNKSNGKSCTRKSFNIYYYCDEGDSEPSYTGYASSYYLIGFQFKFKCRSVNKTGYYVLEWSGDNFKWDADSFPPSEIYDQCDDVKVYAVWEPKPTDVCKIDFDVNAGSDIVSNKPNPLTGRCGTVFHKPTPDPVRSGNSCQDYNFLGWYTKTLGNSSYISITMSSNGGYLIENGVFTRFPGFNFINYFSSSDNSTYDPFDWSDEVNKDYKLYALWSGENKKTTIIYKCEPEDVEVDVDYSSTVYFKNAPCSHGDKNLLGWRVNGDSTNLYKNSGVIPIRDYCGETVTVTPVYPDVPGQYCTITFDGNGGGDTINGKPGDLVGLCSESFTEPDEIPRRISSNTGLCVDYLFTGWYDNSEGGDKYNWDVVVSTGKTLYAHWDTKALKTKINFECVGGKSVEVDPYGNISFSDYYNVCEDGDRELIGWMIDRDIYGTGDGIPSGLIKDNCGESLTVTPVYSGDAYLQQGQEIKSVFEDIIGGSKNITFVRDYTGNSILSSRWVNISANGMPVYVATGNSGNPTIIYYYTDATNIYMNPDSAGMFESLPFSGIDISDWNASMVTDMSNMFYGCSGLNKLDFGSNWDVRKVEDMSSMFEGCSGKNFTGLDFSNWNTSSLTNMTNMFSGCKNLKSIEFGDKWNTSSVTGMAGIFYGCSGLTVLDFSKGNWNTSNVEYMANMFSGCIKLTTIKVDTGFVTDKVTDNGENMFLSDTKLVGGGGTTYSSGHIDREYARIDCPPLASGYFTSDIYGVCDDIAYLITGTDINTAMISLAGSKAITKFEKSGVEPGSEVTRKISIEDSPDVIIWYDGDSKSIKYYTVAKKMYLNPDSSHMFEGLNQLSSINTSEWDTSKVENMKGMFSGCSSLQNFDFSKGIWNTSNVINMEGVFNGCSNITSFDFSKGIWSTSKVINMSSLFRGCFNLQGINFGNYWSTSGVINMSSMFEGCSSLQEIVFDDKWDTSNVYNMSGMFDGCSALTSLDLSNFDTSQLQIMDRMFYKCEKLKTIYAAYNFVVSTVVSHNDVFTSSTELSGGNGTVYSDLHVDKEYARIDCAPEAPGYFTLKEGDPICSNDAIILKKGRDVNWIIKVNLGAVGAQKIMPWYGESPVETKWNIALEGDGNDPVRAWYDKSKKVVYYYPSSNKKVYLNADSSRMFRTFPSLQEVQISDWYRNIVNNAEGMFYINRYLTGILLGDNWTKTNITNMKNMFNGCINLKSLDLSGLDTSNVTDMRFMFANCETLTGLDLSSWDTSSVTNMFWMFWGAKNLKVIDLSSWDTSNVKDMEDMFINCKELKTIYASDKFTTKNIKKWVDPFLNDTKLVGGCETSYSGEKSKYGTTKASQVKYARIDEGPDSDNPGYFTNKDIIVLKKGRDVNSVIKSFGKDNVKKIKLRTGEKSLVETGNNIALDAYDSVRVWYKSGIVYYYPSSEKKVYLNPDSSNMFEGLPNLQEVLISDLYPTYLTNVSGMFNNDSNLVSVILGDNWTASGVTNMASMFKGCSGLTGLDLSSWKTSNVTNMSSMFEGCSGLTSLDLSSWDTSNVTNMSSMFKGCSKLQGISFGDKWSTSNVKNMSSMFEECSSLIRLNFSKGNWDTFKVENMSSLFKGCSSLTSLDLSIWNTSKVTNMSSMFEGCSGLIELNLSGWETSKVENMSSMFEGCSGLTSLNLLGWKIATSNVTINMSSLFKGCSSLTGLDLSSWETKKVKKMSSMFEGCLGLNTIYVSSKFEVKVDDNGKNMFLNDEKLVGGSGTKYIDTLKNNTEYARIDEGPDSAKPGYFTRKSS